MDEVVSGGFCTRVGSKCGRWNPTEEQVKVLTDLFTSGLRTPTTEQIQKISSHLSSLGNIESKNVFYWFQNHKARERHHHHKKRRRGGSDLYLLPPEKRESSRNCAMMGEQEVVWERRREPEIGGTLELFPLSSYDSEGGEKLRMARTERREMIFLDAGRDPPLDLRLSFF